MRPLAFGEHLAWVWYLAIAALLLYTALALLFPQGIAKTVQTLESRPGGSILASVLTVLLTPVLFVLLVLTGIGIALVPFLGIALVIAVIFGKATMLAWLGRRITRYLGDGPLSHPAFAVLIGGVIVLILYTIPVVGLLVSKLVGLIGLGVVVYTLLLRTKRERQAAPSAAGPMAPAMVGVVSGAASTSTIPPVGSIPPSAVPAPSVVPMVVADTTLPRAGFWIRTGALILDVVLVGILLGVSHGVFPWFVHAGPGMLPVLAAYGAIMWKLKGTTIGGIICGLKVVRGDNRPIDWPTAIVRGLGCFLSLFVIGLGFIWVAIDDEKQSWHDKIAGTIVVSTRGSVSLV
jgi:uncharacterized RDD family membrane protein YckC